MCKMNLRKNQGLIGIIILIVIGIFALSYFGISLRQISESDTGKENIGFVKEIFTNVWDSYLKDPAEYIWNTIWLEFAWHPFVDTLQSLKVGNGTNIDPQSPNLIGDQ